ncbi:DUF4352 domain-containing protein [Streptomyces sp. NPDC060048]|uniref:DUF4352 domain-containing protein n=1 Tax=unclassified Streptomyces TaxID=2593676 RepID=UPI00369F0319
MSTPPNPPITPSGPPTEPEGTPEPEASIPAPSRPLSLEKPATEPAAEAGAEAEVAAEVPAARSAEVPAEVPAARSAEVPAEVPAARSAEVPAEVPAEVVAAAPAATPAAPPAEAPAEVPAESPAEVPAAAAQHSAPPVAPAPGAFAPVGPAPAAAAPPAPPYGAPYGAPYGHGAPGAPQPGNPWGAPGGGFQAPHPAGFPPPPPASNGMAVAALLLGLFGIFVSLIPFFFWAGALLALTGLGLGIAAVVRSRKGAPRAAMATVGTALSLLGVGASVGGWFITSTVIDKIDRTVAEERRYGDYYEDDLALPSTPALPTPKASPSPSQVPGMTSALPFGETFKYPSGVEVKVSAPKKYVTDSEYIKVGNAVEVTLTITNNSTETLNIIYSVPNLRDEQGLAGKLVFDGEMPKMVRGDILPGATATGVIAYEVPKGTANLTADITPGGRLPSVKYSGPIG